MIGDLIKAWSDFVLMVTNGNDMLASTITLTAIGFAGVLLRNTPRSLFNFIKRQTTTHMTINNGGSTQEDIMGMMMSWMYPKLNSKWSRSISIEPKAFKQRFRDDDNGREGELGIGYGVHFFFYKKRLFWVDKKGVDSSGSERQKYEVTISTFGRSHKPFQDIFNDILPVEKDNTNKVYRLDNGGDWDYYTKINKRSLDSVAMDSDLRNTIRQQVTDFKNNRNEYLRCALPHKQTYLLHGPPGTGKTSLIKGIASEFDMNLCIMNVHQLTDSTLEKAIARVRKNSVIIIEDFDSSSSTHSRKVSTDSNSASDDNTQMSFLSMTGILNALDGIVPIDECIVMLTTNHKEHLDPAIYRPGRVDYTIEIGEINGKSIAEYVKHLYPDYNISGIHFKPCLGCKLNTALLYAKNDPDKFIEKLVEMDIADIDEKELIEDQVTN